MLFFLSLALVFGVFGLLMAAAGASDPSALPIPTSWLIHARTPVGLLALVASGVALGVLSLFRRPRWFKIPIVAAEVAAAGLLGFYFLDMSFLPERTLGVAVGDSFPAWELPDQDGRLRRFPQPEGTTGTTIRARNRALYIFYRGDW